VRISPVGVIALDVDQSIAHCDGTFIDKSTGAQSAYAKGVLIASAAWRAVVACSAGASSSPSSLKRASKEQVPSSYHLRIDFWMVGSAVGSTNMGTD
jgi:hypothetical protein